jgi:hypothetical protein
MTVQRFLGPVGVPITPQRPRRLSSSHADETDASDVHRDADTAQAND